MTQEDGGGCRRKRRRLEKPHEGAYVLKPFLENIRLAREGIDESIHINCVEFWNDHLYIGTSASEILHFVSLPPEPSGDSNQLTLIEASRVQPAGYGNEGTLPHTRGVRSITILPAASRVCVLCNGTVSFYTLPELSPAPNGKEVHGCQWVGGLDLNQDEDSQDFQDLMVANSKRITIVRVSDRIQGLKNIQFPRCLKSARRDTIACVADGQNYALLEVEHQQKIPLFPLSSAGDAQGTSLGHVETLPVQENSLPARTSSLLAPHSPLNDGGSSHSRSSSLGNFVSGRVNRQESPRADSLNPERYASLDTRSRPRSPSHALPSTGNTLQPGPPYILSAEAGQSPVPASLHSKGARQDDATRLQPHILSLTSSEFLLTTGTTVDEPGVGMFVNLEGDVVRGTIQFERYPISIAFDPTAQASDSADVPEELFGSLCVMMESNASKGSRRYIQVLTLTPDLGDLKSNQLISLPEENVHIDIQSSFSRISHSFDEVADLLRLVRVQLPDHFQGEGHASDAALSGENIPQWETKRNVEEAAFARNFGTVTSQVLVWSNATLFCLCANPFILQLEARFHAAGGSGCEDIVTGIFAELRNREVQTETDFLGFNYIRQKASFVMLRNLMTTDSTKLMPETIRTTENLLVESNLDPRIVLLCMPLLSEEVLYGPQGMWLSAGLAAVLEDSLEFAPKPIESIPTEFWQMLKQYLATWQAKRGYGSIIDEEYVFDSIDAALLHVLLHLEQSVPRGSTAATSARVKLNNVVDNWKGNLNRAVVLLERYQRLFALSRLYQSRRLAKDVLSTWRRVIDGEVDSGGELTPGAAETQIRRYLVNIRDAALVEEYAFWLAQRNPKLAVEFFTDDKSRVKFEPSDALQLLQKNAPGAVQIYLEYLVFDKGDAKYADDLIGYYLDSVLDVLEGSQAARDSLAESYSAYRALEPPKPTYLAFIHENAPSDPWWQSRLRLLQLLGGGAYASAPASSGSGLRYSIPTVLARLAPFSSFLVSESIILDARQGRHREALRLLTHGLGDYDTAVRYCYFASPQASSSGFIDASQLPPFETQRDLFNALLEEFLAIEDLDSRLERSSELLAKFAKWFEPIDVLSRIPEDWKLDVLAEFLLRTMRALKSEMLEVSVVKALSAAENLRKQAEFVEFCERLGARTEAMTVEKNEDNVAGETRVGDVDLAIR